MASMYAKSERYKKFLKYMFEKYEPECCFCHQKLDWRSFYRNISGLGMDDITEHHLDGNHSNDVISNRTLSHRKCHLKYHRQKEIADLQEKQRKIIERIRNG